MKCTAIKAHAAESEGSQGEPPSGGPESYGDREWYTWFRRLGQQMRQLREFIGLSQDELARLAGVSQGAISRLERGVGVATPALGVLRLAVALAHQSRDLRGELADSFRPLLESLERIGPATELETPQPLTREPELEKAHRLFRAASPRTRRTALKVLEALVGAEDPGDET